MSSMTRIVIDANVLVSAAFGGTPLDAVSKAFSSGEVLLSPDVIEEIDGTIRRLSPKLGEEKTEFLTKLWRRLSSLCSILEPVGKGPIRIVTPRQFLDLEDGRVDLAGIRKKIKRLAVTDDDVTTAVRRARRRK